jgi:hypothetical protein
MQQKRQSRAAAESRPYRLKPENACSNDARPGAKWEERIATRTLSLTGVAPGPRMH